MIESLLKVIRPLYRNTRWADWLYIRWKGALDRIAGADVWDLLYGPPRPRPVGRRTARLRQQIKDDYMSRAGEELGRFLASGERLRFPAHERPAVSVILLLFNRAELTLSCLRSLHRVAGEVPFEVVMIDNASCDATANLFARLDGVQAVRNLSNAGFPLACNAAGELARGRHLLFLNNGCEIIPGCMAAAVGALEADRLAGAVGCQVFQLDGSLQSAGCIVWRNGASFNYGRDDDPGAAEYQFRRYVDYAEGAFLLTPAALFRSLGGFDPAYAPTFYEEVDYCFRLRARGHRVLYIPEARVHHYEFASSGSPDRAIELQHTSREIFVAKHLAALSAQFSPDLGSVLGARSAGPHPRRVLFIDDLVPVDAIGSGLPRTKEVLRAMDGLGLFVTYYPAVDQTVDQTPSWEEVYRVCPRKVEVMIGWGRRRLRCFLRSRWGYYDTLVVSRPHNMRKVAALRRRHPAWFAGVRVVYDAEALFSSRDQAARELGVQLPPFSERWDPREEFALALAADCVLTVSEIERRKFQAAGVRDVRLLSHAVDLRPTPAGYHDRSGFLFVGPVFSHPSPNSDAILWFAGQVLPRIREALGADAVLHLVGRHDLAEIKALDGESVRLIGAVDDLTPYFDRCRVFVAPTRFASGIPLKVCESAARGVPVVATDLLASQLGWTDRVELLAASRHDPGEFARKCVELYRSQTLWESVRGRALQRVSDQFSETAFTDTLRAAIGNGEGVGPGADPGTTPGSTTYGGRPGHPVHEPSTPSGGAEWS